MQEKIKWACRYAPSLGALEDTPENIWGTESEFTEIAFNDPVVFFGLYGLPDFYKLWRHEGRKAILWCGTDILHFRDGYWLEDGGSIKIRPKPLSTWINKHCESYVENEVEYAALKELGIESIVVPSFLGKVADYEISYVYSKTPKLYTSVSGDDFKRYGWGKIPVLAKANPNIEFHLYGNTKLPK